MFLRNKSKSATVTIRTKCGLISVAPQQTVEIEEKDILTKHSFLEPVNEKAEVTESPTPSVQKSEEIVPVVKEPEVVAPQVITKEEEPIIVEDNKEEKEPEVLDELQEKALEVVVVPELTELEKLEQELESLKQTWLITTRPKKKEALQKRIKEVESQIANLK